MKYLLLAVGFAALGVTAACDAGDGPIEQAAEDVDESLDTDKSVGDEIGEAIDETGEEIDQAAENAEQAIDDAGERMEETIDPPEKPE